MDLTGVFQIRQRNLGPPQRSAIMSEKHIRATGPRGSWSFSHPFRGYGWGDHHVPQQSANSEASECLQIISENVYLDEISFF